MGRYTKIVATLGPASSRADQIDAPLHAGVDVFRLNLSHGELADHLDRLAMVRERSAVAGRPVAVLADLPGPKIRSGEFPDGEFLAEGVTLRLMPGRGRPTPTWSRWSTTGSWMISTRAIAPCSAMAPSSSPWSTSTTSACTPVW